VTKFERILRDADRAEKGIQYLCREENLLVVTFHRWKKQFGQMEVKGGNETRKLDRVNFGRLDNGFNASTATPAALSPTAVLPLPVELLSERSPTAVFEPPDTLPVKPYIPTATLPVPPLLS
jgi:hypothetical protein